MRLRILFATLVVLSDLFGTAQADMSGPPGAPSFTEADRAEIARNDLLRSVVDKDPWLVRRILDLGARLFAGTPEERRDASGSVEWIDLLRRARAERDAPHAGVEAPASRSTEGSVEMLDLMKAAKLRKTNQ